MAAAPAKDHISAVYEAFGKLADAKENAGQEKKSFEALIDAVKGDSKVKQLAAQYLPRFFKFFPDLAERALNAQLDLCEDPELAVRVHAIRSLAELCQGSPAHVPRIADVLGQLLVAEDHTELATVKRTFHALFDIDARAAYAALINQIKESVEPARAKGIAFFKEQQTATKQLLDKNVDLQKDVAASIRKLLAHPDGITAEEFKFFLDVLQSFKVVRDDVTFPAEVANIIIKQANLDAKFDPANTAYISQVVSCLRTATQWIAKATRKPKEGAAAAAAAGAAAAPAVAAPAVDANVFVNFFFGKALPVLDAIPQASRTELVRAIVGSAKFVDATAAAKLLEPLLETIKKLVPKAAAPAAGAAAAAPADLSKIDLLTLEALLFIFQTFAAKAPDTIRRLVGVFVPSGQPTDLLPPDVAARKEDLFARIRTIADAQKPFLAQCKSAADNIAEDLKKLNKENAAAAKANRAAAAAAATTTPAAAAAAGQPGAAAATDAKAPAPAAAAAAAGDAGKEAALAKKRELQSKRLSVDQSARAVQNVALLLGRFAAKIPHFGPGDNFRLSWQQQQPQGAAGKGQAQGQGQAQGKGQGNGNAKASGNAKGTKRKADDKKKGGGKEQKLQAQGKGGKQQPQQKQQQQQQKQGGGPAKKQKNNAGQARAKTPQKGQGQGQGQGQKQGGGRAASKSPAGGKKQQQQQRQGGGKRRN